MKPILVWELLYVIRESRREAIVKQSKGMVGGGLQARSLRWISLYAHVYLRKVSYNSIQSHQAGGSHNIEGISNTAEGFHSV